MKNNGAKHPVVFVYTHIPTYSQVATIGIHVRLVLPPRWLVYREGKAKEQADALKELLRIGEEVAARWQGTVTAIDIDHQAVQVLWLDPKKSESRATIWHKPEELRMNPDDITRGLWEIEL